MKILLTGANGYIGMRVLHQLLDAGHQVVCAVRDETRLSVHEETRRKLEVVEVDFLEDPKPGLFEGDFDVAYYLIHSMSSWFMRSGPSISQANPGTMMRSNTFSVCLKYE